MTTDWYKDAVFYEVFVRAFADSTGNGRGDLPGLSSKLDYLKDLGIDAIWMLPISPSPLRDDGYDVSNYVDIHPDYGTMDDFRSLVTETHKRDLRIIVELVPNHSSDQHPWFKASRDPNHPAHSKYRDWYVWSDTDQKYAETRIIFLDYEASNWTYDELRGQYYWHRFFHHQPDLNYDNPEVQRAMMRVLQFWIDQGVDGIRIDAPPYLFEREGTNCENLPETHTYLKRVRAFVDAYAPGTMLLSESNMWPEDVRPYFGDGDEMHMNFHFPLMPRIFMALAKANRAPIVEIMQLTPELPASCQWGTFLRCHDELTLEMVSQEERAFMWDFYAPETRMRLNLGIRRRLAPLLGNTQRIQVVNAILLTFIGSPFLYYGDEIGMGDNIWLDDRDGLRTPMQWDKTINAGFSSAPSEKLCTPVIESGTFSFQRVNVADQAKDSSSLLNWMKRVLHIRKKYPAFGRGDLTLLAPQNPAILAYVRTYKNDVILILNNLSPDPQATNINLSTYDCTKMVDLFTQKTLTQHTSPVWNFNLEGYSYHWLKLI